MYMYAFIVQLHTKEILSVWAYWPIGVFCTQLILSMHLWYSPPQHQWLVGFCQISPPPFFFIV